MSNTKKIRIVDLEVTSLSKKGNGLAQCHRPPHDPVEVEVPFTIPGDKVRASLLRKRSGIYSSKLEEILEPAHNRIKPRCVHFGFCGGCRFQQISYEQQLHLKEQFVREYFGSMLNESVDFRPIVPSAPWHYRNKMEYSFSSDASGKKYLGLILDSSRGKVLNLTECHLTNPWFIDALKAVRQWWHESEVDAYHMHKNTGALRTLTLREGMRTGDRMVMLTVSGNPDFALQKRHIDTFVAFLRDAIEPQDPNSLLSIFLRIQQTAKGMKTNMYEMHLHGPDHIRETLNIHVAPHDPIDLAFTISPSAFFQPNSAQAEKLYSLAISMASLTHNDIVYDLFCGTGAVGLCASKYVRQVIGIELSPESVLDAQANAKRNACSNMTIISGSVGEVLHKQDANIPRPDVVMVDPPRVGLDRLTIEHIVKLNPSKILYISCNPKTQSENVAEFLQHGYQLITIQPVDQFPQTYHIENIVLLKKL